MRAFIFILTLNMCIAMPTRLVWSMKDRYGQATQLFYINGSVRMACVNHNERIRYITLQSSTEKTTTGSTYDIFSLQSTHMGYYYCVNEITKRKSGTLSIKYLIFPLKSEDLERSDTCTNGTVKLISMTSSKRVKTHNCQQFDPDLCRYGVTIDAFQRRKFLHVNTQLKLVEGSNDQNAMCAFRAQPSASDFVYYKTHSAISRIPMAVKYQSIMNIYVNNKLALFDDIIPISSESITLRVVIDNFCGEVHDFHCSVLPPEIKRWRYIPEVLPPIRFYNSTLSDSELKDKDHRLYTAKIDIFNKLDIVLGRVRCVRRCRVDEHSKYFLGGANEEFEMANFFYVVKINSLPKKSASFYVTLSNQTQEKEYSNLRIVNNLESLNLFANMTDVDEHQQEYFISDLKHQLMLTIVIVISTLLLLCLLYCCYKYCKCRACLDKFRNRKQKSSPKLNGARKLPNPTALDYDITNGEGRLPLTPKLIYMGETDSIADDRSSFIDTQSNVSMEPVKSPGSSQQRYPFLQTFQSPTSLLLPPKAEPELSDITSPDSFDHLTDMQTEHLEPYDDLSWTQYINNDNYDYEVEDITQAPSFYLTNDDVSDVIYSEHEFSNTKIS